MPGLERKDVEITIEDDTLTIRGEKKIEENQKDKNVQHSERAYGVFLRVLQLPPGIDLSSVQATMSNGVLKITIPKPAKPEPKKIEVKEKPKQETNQAAGRPPSGRGTRLPFSSRRASRVPHVIEDSRLHASNEQGAWLWQRQLASISVLPILALP